MKYIIIVLLIVNTTSCSGNYLIHECKSGVDFKNLDQLRFESEEVENNVFSDFVYNNLDKFTLTRKCEFEIGDIFFK